MVKTTDWDQGTAVKIATDIMQGDGVLRDEPEFDEPADRWVCRVVFIDTEGDGSVVMATAGYSPDSQQWMILDLDGEEWEILS